MNLFNRVILLIGNTINNQVLKQTLEIVDKKGANLKLLQVGHTIYEQQLRQTMPYRAPQTKSILRLLGQQNFDIYKFIKQSKVKVQYKMIWGDTLQFIDKEIRRDHHDLIVVDSSHKNVAQSHMFTQLGMHLIRRCPIPVLVSRPERTNHQMRIMAAIDPLDISSAFEMPGNALNEKIMALANNIALNSEQNMHVVNCWRHPMVERMRKNKSLSDAKIHKTLIEARAQQKMRLTQFLNKNIHQQVNYRVHLRHGNPEIQIDAVARDNHINLVVLGSVGRSGLDGLMIGNTAESILCNTNLSVLVVKPSSYQPVSINAITPAEAACEL